MTLLLPHEKKMDRWLRRIGHPRAYSTAGLEKPHGTSRAVPEPLWRSLLRRKGAVPPEGWFFLPEEQCPENPPPEQTN
ncbi:MAG: hypothetical protein JJU29_21030 [Verrucomicrobia bacterium]|nr:hypothetical protein [Verrucomicrobiota bacterium]MCH8513855.1 hypothetical protein [Kiritimatiellia bacterium]